MNLKWLGAKFYDEVINKVRHLCAHMDISIEEIRSKLVRLWRPLILYYYKCHIYLKYRIRVVYRTEYEPRFFSGEGGGAYLKGGAYSKF